MAEYDLTTQIASLLSEYTNEVTQDVKQICKDVSNEMTENIKKDSKIKFKGEGVYEKGWKTKIAYEDKDNIRITTYNSKEANLTHLLEFGHAKQNGGRVEGKPHIAPNEDIAKKELIERIEKAVAK
jgi:nucleoid DNA-binding protein